MSHKEAHKAQKGKLRKRQRREIIKPGAPPQERYRKGLKALKARNTKHVIPRLQRSDDLTALTWADGPGFHISRRWRSGLFLVPFC